MKLLRTIVNGMAVDIDKLIERIGQLLCSPDPEAVQLGLQLLNDVFEDAADRRKIVEDLHPYHHQFNARGKLVHFRLNEPDFD